MRKHNGLILALAAVLAMASPALAQERHEAWEKAWQRLLLADRESLAALNAALSDVNGSFRSADANTRGFVDDMLGWNGRWNYTVGIGGQAVNFGAAMIDGVFGTRLGAPAGDSFRDFARGRFRAAVFDPEVFKRGIGNAGTAYAAKLRSIENRLLVDLAADLPDGELLMPTILHPRLSDALLWQVDAAVDDVISDTGVDFGVTVGKEIISQVGGNVATGLVFSSGMLGTTLTKLGNDPFSMMVLGTGTVVGYGVSRAVDKAVEAAGVDPAAALAAKLQSRLRLANEIVFEGQVKDSGPQFIWLSLFREAHPQAASRKLCGDAADRMERSAFIGLRPMLLSLHARRLCVRRLAVYRALFGQDAALPAELMLDAQQAREAGKVVSLATDLLKLKGE